jgi:hypothetical protein
MTSLLSANVSMMSHGAAYYKYCTCIAQNSVHWPCTVFLYYSTSGFNHRKYSVPYRYATDDMARHQPTSGTQNVEDANPKWKQLMSGDLGPCRLRHFWVGGVVENMGVEFWISLIACLERLLCSFIRKWPIFVVFFLFRQPCWPKTKSITSGLLFRCRAVSAVSYIYSDMVESGWVAVGTASPALSVRVISAFGLGYGGGGYFRHPNEFSSYFAILLKTSKYFAETC